ncbi:hypothetical protein FDP41_002351 [Naegleria fowleri]|uniref:Protein kinase domain-containing protein n=1 Tax=Naegleria fowleri TaxID=5763 RepID=A0A6A5BVS2_NAEFO|nr:uncharacterized protein FDP41_002351 [Naegleria fowleri]KAF0978531.1 hypothetical protein FDP41_002351 [Naegleria fowleri]
MFSANSSGQTKRSTNPFITSFAESALEDIASFKTMVKGSSRFELQEEDTLPEKERVIQNELSSGEYHISIESAGNAKFQFTFKVTSKVSEIFSAEGTLYGRGQKGAFDSTFNITEEQAPANVELRLVNRARFWQKPSYKFHLIKSGDDQVQAAQENLMKSFDNPSSSPIGKQPNSARKSNSTTTIPKSSSLPSISPNKKLKVKLSYKQETTIISIFLSMTMDDLYEIISSHYSNFPSKNNFSEKVSIKYVDDEDKELISIRTQTDLDHFVESSLENFQNFQNSSGANVYKKPKLIIEDVVSSRASTGTDGLPSSPLTTTKVFPTKRTKIKTWIKGNMIGAGANGKVFLGINSETGQMMAIKEIEIKGKTNREEVKKIMEEVELMSQFDHPHIVRYLGSFVSNKHLNIFLDYIPGGSMETLLLEFSLPENLIRKYCKQILEGLSYLHENGVVHCDIKSGNILVDERSNVYLTDFGCSKKLSSLAMADDSSSPSNTGNFVIAGTPNYIAPEVIRDRTYTQAADIWSFGCTVCEMFSQNPPWSHVLSKFEQPVHPIQLMHYIMTTENDSVEIPANSSQVAKDFIRCCLQRDPSKRATAKQLLEHPFIVNDNSDELESVSQMSIGITPRTPHEYSRKKGDDEEEDVYEDDGFTFDDFPTKDFSDDSDDEDLYSNNPIYRSMSHKKLLKSRPGSSITTYSAKSSFKEKPIYENNNHLAPPGITAIQISPPEENESTLSQTLEVLNLKSESSQLETKIPKSRIRSAELRKHSSANSNSFVSMQDNCKFGSISIRANENDIKNFLRNNAHIQQSSLSSARKVEPSPASTPSLPETVITIPTENNDQ